MVSSFPEQAAYLYRLYYVLKWPCSSLPVTFTSLESGMMMLAYNFDKIFCVLRIVSLEVEKRHMSKHHVGDHFLLTTQGQ
jgi:hypothetical protein